MANLCRNVFAVISWFACFLGLVWQLYHICQQYFSYQLTTKVLIETPKTVQAPAMTVEFMFGDAVYTAAPNTTDAALAMSPTGKDSARTEDNYRRRNSTVEKFVHFDFDALKFAYKLRSDHVMNRNDPDIVILSFALLKDHFFYTKKLTELTFKIFIHSRDKVYEEYDTYIFRSSGYVANTTDGNTMKREMSDTVLFLSYDQYALNFQRAPYDTNCYNYSEIGCTSQQSCINECIIRDSLRELQSYPNSALIAESGKLFDLVSNQTLITNSALGRADSEIAAKVSEITQRCESRHSKQDCNQEKFVLYLEHAAANSELEVQLQRSKRPFITASYLPQITTTDFIVYIICIASFWLNVAPLTMLLYCSKLVTKKVSRKTTADWGRDYIKMKCITLTNENLAMKEQIANIRKDLDKLIK